MFLPNIKYIGLFSLEGHKFFSCINASRDLYIADFNKIKSEIIFIYIQMNAYQIQTSNGVNVDSRQGGRIRIFLKMTHFMLSYSLTILTFVAHMLNFLF